MLRPNTQRHHIGATSNRKVSEDELRRDACSKRENLLGREVGKKRSRNGCVNVKAQLQILHVRSPLAVRASELVQGVGLNKQEKVITTNQPKQFQDYG
jgi:hypothetical protein